MSQQEEQNLAAIKKIYEAMFVGNMEAMKPFLDPDITVFEAESLPYGGVYRGISGVERLSRIIFETWDDMDFKLEGFTVGGDRAVALLHFSAKGKKTGKYFSFPIAEAWRFRDGKAIEWRPFYYDPKRASDAFGD
jgi:uncharacterized protein